jgi:hypothetical protein
MREGAYADRAADNLVPVVADVSASFGAIYGKAVLRTFERDRSSPSLRTPAVLPQEA